MKKLLTLAIVLLSMQSFAPKSIYEIKIKPMSYKEKLIKAISIVESGEDSLIVNHNEDAIGLLQIRRVYVDEANRLSSYKKYKYSDRYSKKKSIEMFEIIMNHWASGYDIDSVACVHNSGGYNWKSTEQYRIKVKKAFNMLEELIEIEHV